VDAKKASQIVWLDALSLMTERSGIPICYRHKELWLIDHGASLIFIILDKLEKHAQSPFALIKDHVLLQASMLRKQMLYSRRF
jgi:hypothetical protein